MDNKLRLLQWNIEDFFIHMNGVTDIQSLTETQWQDLSGGSCKNKPLKKIKECAELIKYSQADIIMINEVGGEEALSNFNEHFLDSNFKPLLIEGNSDRGIDVGYLVKKNLDFKFELHTNKHLALNLKYKGEPEDKKNYFSRDVAELHAFNTKNHKLVFILLLVHLKSHFDVENKDPLGFLKRRAEVEATIKIYKDLKKEVGEETFIMLAGDFNGNASNHNTDLEFKDIYEKTDLIDALDALEIPMAEKITRYRFFPNQNPSGGRLDYIFLPKNRVKQLEKDSCKVINFKDPWGQDCPPPKNLTQRRALPSDHYPVMIEISLR